MAERKRTWLEYTHPVYAASSEGWTYAWDHYSADVVLDTGKTKTYLVKRVQGESQEAFDERAKLADLSNHFAAIVDALAGMVFAVDSQAKRVFSDETSKGLGAVDDPDSTIGRLMRDADGYGTGWLTLHKMLATRLIVFHSYWGVVDADAEKNPVLRYVDPLSVTNWRYAGNRLVEVLIKEEMDTRTSIESEDISELESTYVHYKLDGWQRYKLDKDGAPVPMNSGVYTYKDRLGIESLPVYHVQLPLGRAIGYTLAKKQNVIFNQESARDHLLRVANFPKLVLFADDTLYDSLVDALKKGSSVLQQKPEGSAHTYIAPSAEPVTAAGEVLKRKVEEFYQQGFKMYGDAAAQKTATEVRQDVAAGVGAFLQLLSAALDDAENNALWRIEQALDPVDTASHFVSYVKRSENFVPPDVNETIKALSERYFGTGKALPVGREARIAALKKILEQDGIIYQQQELEAAVDATTLGEFTKAFTVSLPAEARVQLLLKVLAASGAIDPEATVEMADGNKVKLLAVIESEARKQAMAEDETARRQAEMAVEPSF